MVSSEAITLARSIFCLDAWGASRTVQSARRPLRHFVTYGRTNRYIPVKNIKASAATAKRPIQLVYLCLNTATPLKITTNVKAMDSQRCNCRTHLFQFNGDLLSTVGLNALRTAFDQRGRATRNQYPLKRRTTSVDSTRLHRLFAKKPRPTSVMGMLQQC